MWSRILISAVAVAMGFLAEAAPFLCFAQDFQYVNPHIAPDGNYVPGYYRTRGAIPPKLNPNPLYFPIDGRDAPYSGKFPGAQYFNLNPALSPYATEQWPYFTAP